MEGKKQIGQLISGMAHMSVSDEEEGGKMLTLSEIYSREQELAKKQMEVQEKVLRSVVDDSNSKQLSEICKEFGAVTNPVKEVGASLCEKIDSVYMSLALSCLKKEKKYKEALKTLQLFCELNQAQYESNKVLEMARETVVADDQSERKLLETEQERSVLNSSDNEVEIKKENEAADSSTLMDGGGKPKRIIQKPERFEHSADHIKKGKGKGKGKKRI